MNAAAYALFKSKVNITPYYKHKIANTKSIYTFST